MVLQRVENLGLMRNIAMIALIGIMAGLLPARTYAAQGGAGHYESAMLGFTVEWDEENWSGEPIPADETTEGVAMDTPLTWGNIRGSVWADVDEEACVEYMAESFEDGASVKSVKRASRSLEMPSDELGGEQGLYVMTMGPSENGDTELAMYLQCISFADDEAALMVMLVANLNAYESELPAWNGLLSGIVPGDGPVMVGQAREQEEEPASGDGTYVNDDLGFSVSWDEDFWASSDVENEDNQGIELESETSFGLVAAMPADEAFDQRLCVETLASAMEESEGFKRVRKAGDDMTTLETVPGAYGQLYTMLSTNSPTRVAMYVECRSLPDSEYMLVIHLTADARDFEDEAPKWQELIDGVKVANTGDASGDEKSNDGEPNPISGGAFAGVNYVFTIAYDESIWAAEEYTEEGYDWLSLTSEYGQVTIVATASDVDMDGCIDTLVDDEYDYATGNIDPAPRSFELPETADGAKGTLFAYEGVAENGDPVDTLVYFDCRWIEEGESLIAVTFTATPELYEKALPALEELLINIEIG